MNGRAHFIPLAWLMALTPIGALAQEPDPYAPAPEQVELFDLLGVHAAWAHTRGSTECPIGVVDNGFDFFHPALRAALQPGYCADGVYHTTSASLIGHGTLVASIMAARNVEEGGMVGLAPDCPILCASTGMPLHTLLLMQADFRKANPDATMEAWQAYMQDHAQEMAGFGSMWIGWVGRTMAEGIGSLIEQGARVISISGFLPRETIERVSPAALEQLDAAFQEAIDRDVIIVLGAGNDGQPVSGYPGSLETVLVVGASTLSDARWEESMEVMGQSVTQGSSYGPRLSVMAPVERIKVALPHDAAQYQFQATPMGPEDQEWDGSYQVLPSGATSSAAPVVASLAALVRSLRPDLTARQVIEVIHAGAVDLGETGRDDMTGYGRVDFARTLELAASYAAP